MPKVNDVVLSNTYKADVCCAHRWMDTHSGGYQMCLLCNAECQRDRDGKIIWYILKGNFK